MGNFLPLFMVSMVPIVVGILVGFFIVVVLLGSDLAKCQRENSVENCELRWVPEDQ